MQSALISPPGRGALAVIHVAGTGASELARRLLGKAPSAEPICATLRQDGERIDEVMARVVEGFTAEETVEITCHGGPAVVRRVLEALEKGGAAPTDAAGLLERAVETGALDRIRAEAWALLPYSATELSARVLQDQADGALSAAVRNLSAPPDAGKLLSTAPLGVALASPRRVVLAGSPNVGKSTLFNALVRQDRALVSPVPGTTRDPVRETISIDQVPVELIDTAGVEEARDLLEQLAIDRTRSALRTADLVLFVFDAQAGAQGPELRFLETLAHPRVILLVNKVDVGTKKPLLESIPVSARTGQGLEIVRRKILSALAVVPRHSEGDPVVFTARQERVLALAARGRMPVGEAREELLKGAGVQ